MNFVKCINQGIWSGKCHSDWIDWGIKKIRIWLAELKSKARRALMKDDLPRAACLLPDGAAKAAAVDIVCFVVFVANVCGKHAIVRKRLNMKVFNLDADIIREGGKRITGAVAVDFS
jgi:hypothetical protein